MIDFYKYPRTFHCDWSLGSTSDDKFLENMDAFIGMSGVLSEKMDGENTNMYPDRIHARSIDSKDHLSRHWVKGLWGSIKDQIPTGWRICGENMYAKHSIFYDDLETYFYVYSIWDENNMCLSWNDTLLMCETLNLTPVRVIETLIFDEEHLREVAKNLDTTKVEGYVFRNINSFHYDDFSDNVFKWVRKGHVNKNSTHWMYDKIIPNKIISQ